MQVKFKLRVYPLLDELEMGELTVACKKPLNGFFNLCHHRSTCKWTQKAFQHLLSALGHTTAAVQLGEQREGDPPLLPWQLIPQHQCVCPMDQMNPRVRCDCMDQAPVSDKI